MITSSFITKYVNVLKIVGKEKKNNKNNYRFINELNLVVDKTKTEVFQNRKK